MLVISVLMLVMFFVLGFFLRATGEKRSSHLMSHLLSAQLLEESVVSMVMAQIREATNQGPEVGWASQPGMIRTFGSKESLVKLYSSREMIKEVSGDVPFDVLAEVPSDWMNYPAMYRDLNRPMRDMDGRLQYPIFDPRVEAEGLQVVDAPASPDNEAPMPVRWLYVLRNGVVLSAREDGSEDEVALEGRSWRASENNPIVGRIAFWTDDDTCKININTAAGDEWQTGEAPGSYHEVPRTWSRFDREMLAGHPPVQGEYQRYPGHPATTSISAVFPWLSQEEIGGIAPRIESGGSLGGTVWNTDSLMGDVDRLYSSVDELVFDQRRRSQEGLKAGEIEGRGFLLSTNSRASELNVFGWPRVAMWPLAEDELLRSGYDRFLAFCSSLVQGTDTDRYYFTRQNSKHAEEDFVSSERNQELYAYLQRLTSREVPGRLGTFAGKYGEDRDQILTQMVDHIRSTNIYDGQLTEGQFTSPRISTNEVEPGHGQVVPLKVGDTMGFGRFYTLSEIGLQFISTADPRAVQSNQVANGNGMFKNYTLGDTPLTAGQRRIEALLLMELFSPSMGWPVLRPDMQIRIRGLDQFAVNGESLGFPADATMRHRTSAGEVVHGRSWGGSGGFQFLLKDRKLPARGPVPADSGLTEDNVYPFVSVPITVEGPDGGTMEFQGGEIEVLFYAGAESPLEDENLVQKIHVRFPDGEFIMPGLVSEPTPEESTPEGDAVATLIANWWTFSADGGGRLPNGGPLPNYQGRLHFAGQLASDGNVSGEAFKFYAGGMFRATDTVRTLVPKHGDYRLIAAQAEVPVNHFEPHRLYHEPTARFAHSLGTSTGQHWIYGSDLTGRLVQGVEQNPRAVPDIPAGLLGPSTTGDWDTGLGAEVDGAYINKPDEGNSYRELEEDLPYFGVGEKAELAAPALYSPNRQVSSAVMFGSLPTGVKAGKPWQTLLFRPDVSGTHEGAKSPPDHLWLDLFWMPVVEPYAISEPFSTAGKVNLNYQIIPFTYIERTTALRALFHSERVVAIPSSAAAEYKGGGEIEGTYHFAINADETLLQWQRRFDDGKYFRTASEICDMHLVPEGKVLSDFTGEVTPENPDTEMPEGGGVSLFWIEHALTGDNLRERPYAGLYPRLTTKSNTYTVHYCVQVLEPLKRQRGSDSSAWAKWNEKRDRVLSESRGRVTIERYLDPHDPKLPDFVREDVEAEPDDDEENEEEPEVEDGDDRKGNLDSYYRFRILSSKKLIP